MHAAYRVLESFEGLVEREAVSADVERRQAALVREGRSGAGREGAGVQGGGAGRACRTGSLALALASLGFGGVPRRGPCSRCPQAGNSAGRLEQLMYW